MMKMVHGGVSGCGRAITVVRSLRLPKMVVVTEAVKFWAVVGGTGTRFAKKATEHKDYNGWT